MTATIRDLWLKPVRAERMAAFRIAVAAIVLGDTLISLLPDAADWFGPEAVFNASQYAAWMLDDRLIRWSLLPINASLELVFAILGLLAVSAVLVAIGLFTRPASIVMWALLLSIHNRNPHILNAGDTLLRCATFYLMFMPAGAAWSIDNLIRARRGRPVNGWVAPWPLRFAQFQIVLVYFATGVEKLRGFKLAHVMQGGSPGDWLEGSAVYKALTFSTMGRFPWLFEGLPWWVFAPLTWVTVGFELLFAVLVLKRRTRWPALSVGFCLHLGIFATMEVGHFSFSTLSFYFLLVPAAVLMDIAGRAAGEGGRRTLQVYFDGMCPICKRSKQWLERLDWLGRLAFVDIHDRARALADLPDVSYSDMLSRMHVKRPDGLHFAGFHAFRAMAPVLPLAWPLVPLLWLPGAAAIGARVYDFIARNRFRFAKCENEFCAMHLKLLAGRELDENVIARVIELHEKYQAAGKSNRAPETPAGS